VNLNDDFDRTVRIDTRAQAWVPSPMPGVERRMLDRIGGEIARATSIVRYAAGSRFSPHHHPGGEEFLVLEGTFSDASGDYPAGSYLRNPPGTSHAPFSAPGCVIFVKLWQFAHDDLVPVHIDSATARWIAAPATGLEMLELHEHRGIHTRLLRAGPAASFGELAHPGGMELLVLEGELREGGERHAAGCWLRLPRGAPFHPAAGPEGACIFIKTGHIGASWIPLPGQP